MHRFLRHPLVWLLLSSILGPLWPFLRETRLWVPRRKAPFAHLEPAGPELSAAARRAFNALGLEHITLTVRHDPFVGIGASVASKGDHAYLTVEAGIAQNHSVVLDAALAHEAAHVKLKHSRARRVSGAAGDAVLASAAVLAVPYQLNEWSAGKNVALALGYLVLSWLVFKAQTALSQRHERAADGLALEAGHAVGLEAYFSVALSLASRRPYRSGVPGWLERVFSDHPDTQARLERTGRVKREQAATRGAFASA